MQKQNIEYLNKEKQIVTFLECKKSFFGKVSYFFKGKKKKIKKDVIQEDSKQEDKQELIEEFKLEEKNIYTIEDLLKIGKHLENKEKEYKDKLMDITALENKKENLEKKIKNATLYINEIESHKKSIFDFWKFTNKDESNLLNEGKNDLNQEKHNKIKKVFSYEEDIEDFAIEIDRKQKNILSPKECDAIFAISKDIDSFNIVSKDKILKKDENYIEKTLKAKKEQYEKDYEKIKEKDFDIFGNIVEDKTKIKTLKNHKHREIEKDEYKILDIHVDTALEQYQDVIKHYNKILEESYDKMVCPSDISVYKLSEKTIEDEKWIIMQLNPKVEILKSKTEEEKVILNRINIKENMNALFYSNIVYYDNMNNTLPDGMDIKEEVLLDLKRYELKLISRKNFNINLLNADYKNIIKKIEVYEYDITEKGSRNDK